MKKDFLPTDYSIPETASNYLRFQDGVNKFRILDSAVVGFEYFTSDNKPIRSREPFEETPNLKKDGKVKAFWAFPVWNYQTESVQILEITQKTIMNALKSLIDNEAWGSPVGKYNIVVVRKGEGLDTEYSVMPEPHSETLDDILSAYKDKPANLDALFDNEDPFKKV